MTMSLLSLWLPYLPTDRLKRAGGFGDAEGLVTVAKQRGAQRVTAADAMAARLSIRPGMSLADARAIRPTLRVEQADPDRDTATLSAIADWCGRFTPLIGPDGPDGLMLDITGAAHLFGGEVGVMTTVEAGLLRQGFQSSTAVAATREAAWALARFGPVTTVPDERYVAPDPDDEPAFLAVFGPLPLRALRLPAETLIALEQSGLKRIEDLLARPRAPLVARFGQGLFERLDGLTGLRRSPITPRGEAPLFMAEHRFATPIATKEAVEGTILVLAGHLAALLERQAKGARRLGLTLFRVDGAVTRIVVGTSRPLAQAHDMARLFKEKIEAEDENGLEAGYGFDVVRLEALAVDAADRRQDDLVRATRTENIASADDLADLVDRLSARLGQRRVARLLPQERHIPEHAALAVPALAIPALTTSEAVAPILTEEGLLRPLRLFARPEPVEAVYLVPDGSPQSFRWRRHLHRIVAVEGPERIAPEWWRNDGPTRPRDYFQAEDQDGRRFWLFREGLHGTDEAPLEEDETAPRWFVHGLFG